MTRRETLWELFRSCECYQSAVAEEMASWALRRFDRGAEPEHDVVALGIYRAARQRTALSRTMVNLEVYGTFAVRAA